MKNQKPSFREEGKLIVLDDSKLIFNAQKVGPTNFNGLRKADYREEFRMPTMPELVELVHASLENQNHNTAKEVISTLKRYLLVGGNTAVHYFSKGMFVEDNPEMKERRIVRPNFKILENKLGKHEENGVIFSDDKRIRFTPYNYKKKSQNALDLSQNTGVIAFLGGKKKAEKIARASGHYKEDPCFWTLFNVDSPQTKVAGFGANRFDGGLDVDATVHERYNIYSFGVKETQ